MFVLNVHCRVSKLVLEKLKILYFHHSYLLLVVIVGSIFSFGSYIFVVHSKHTVMRIFTEAVMSSSMVSKCSWLACSLKSKKIFWVLLQNVFPRHYWLECGQLAFFSEPTLLGRCGQPELYPFIPPTWIFWVCISSSERLSHCLFLQS